jgi:tetratricopeptide (TPR) repeat protein
VRALRALLGLALVSGTAHANVWDHAVNSSATATTDKYEAELANGDEHVLAANSRSNSIAALRAELDLALASYRAAAVTRPDAGEPYARIATTLYSFYLESCNDDLRGFRASPLRDCSRVDAIDVGIAEQVIKAWDALETRAPLDPRFSPLGDSNGVLFDRAILHTKLATKDHLQKAVRDYERILDRSGSFDDSDVSRVWGNLAETQMMLGQLDVAIDAYREAARHSSDASTWYGLAVAMDRDGRSSQAETIVRQQGDEAYQTFQRSVEVGNTFFVPRGEVHYYYALIDEAFGNVEASIREWREFIRSGAHPQYQPRAKEHLDALLAKRKFRPIPQLDPFRDL